MKKVIHNITRMNDLSLWLIKGGLMISCSLLLGSIILMAYAGNWTLNAHYLLRCADSLRELSPAVLFITVMGSAWIQERINKRSPR